MPEPSITSYREFWQNRLDAARRSEYPVRALMDVWGDLAYELNDLSVKDLTWLQGYLYGLLRHYEVMGPGED